MILRNITVRHGRRALVPSNPSALRQLTTTTTTTAEPAALAGDNTIETPKETKKTAASIRVLAADPTTALAGSRWTTSRQMTEGGRTFTPAQQFAEFRRVQNQTKKVGSHVEQRYAPTELIRHPPGPEDVTLELLMASQTHMGHNTSLWNPANSRYIYGARHGVHIISLETTAAHLRRASRVVEEVAYRGGLILFVGTRRNQMEIVAKAAELAGGCHLFTRWTPGAITNRDKILAYKQTKVINEKDESLPDFEKFNNGARPLVPDLVICLNPLENYTMLYECGLASVPTIGIIDTDADPSWVTYTIPANDDSLRSVALIGGVLGRAGQRGQARRKEAAAEGQVSWSTAREVTEFMSEELKEVMHKRKEVMGRIQDDLTSFSESESALLASRFASKPVEAVDHEDMLGFLGEAAQIEETEAEAEDAQVELENEASKIVKDFEAMVMESESKTLRLVADVEAVKAKVSKASTTPEASKE